MRRLSSVEAVAAWFWAVLVFTASQHALAMLGVRLAFLDWDEVLVVCMGFAGLAYVIVDQKRERRLDDHALDFAERLSRLEANRDDSAALEGRLRAVEIHAEKEERIEERLAAQGERVAVLETKIDAWGEELKDA